MKKGLVLLLSLLMFMVPTLVSAAPNSTAEENKRTETVTYDGIQYTISTVQTGVIKKIIVSDAELKDVAVLIENTQTGQKTLNGEKIDFNMEEPLHNTPQDGDVSANLVPAPETGTTWSYYTTISNSVNLLTSGTALIGALITIVKAASNAAGTDSILSTSAAISLAIAFLSGVSSSISTVTSKIILYRRWYPAASDYVYQFNNYFYYNGRSLGGFTWNAGYGW
ncbi:hypothetical protein [Mesobacillus sp. S13]|uniref:hypothetical protein n=1 Tax=Mesobacillus sp. S13 TaxID=2880221 RepID=UPI001CF5F5BC|nr:hypothetical protein [Mesobacillus sp. S13]